jgi:hypothetical protein
MAGKKPCQWDFRLADETYSELMVFKGRLMLGALIPLAMLYVHGLSRLLRHQPSLVLGAVGAIAITITISELLGNRVAFTSSYNWFHM